MKKKDEPEKDENAAALARKRWAKVSAKKRSDIGKRVAAARKPGQASRAARSITPEAARARALKAWETKRRKAEEAAREVEDQ